MILTRRDFLQGILSIGIAPSIVRASSLMPGRGIIVPSGLILRSAYREDVDYLEALLGQGGNVHIPPARYALSRSLRLPPIQGLSADFKDSVLVHESINLRAYFNMGVYAPQIKNIACEDGDNRFWINTDL